MSTSTNQEVPELFCLWKPGETHITPQEDTFILLDALEQDSDVLRRMKPTLCLEIGFDSASFYNTKGDNNQNCSSGSGCVSAFMGRILGPSDCCKYLCQSSLPIKTRTEFGSLSMH